MVQANWSGEYPGLCEGEWTLVVDGVDVSDKIPLSLRDRNMNTQGIYCEWCFEARGIEQRKYLDGLPLIEWVKSNDYWLSEITTEFSIKKDIFEAIRHQDFRGGQCGGCL